MIPFAKIVGDMIGGHVVQIAGAVFACIAASEAYGALSAMTAPVMAALK